MKVRDIMSTEVVTIDKDRNLKDVLALMERNNFSKIPVTENGELVGIVTDGKIADKLGREHNRDIQTSTMHVSSVMEKDVIVAHPDEALANLLADVGKPGLTMIPVVQGKKLVGVVTKSDLLRLVKSDAKVSTFMTKELRSVGPGERLVHVRRLLLDHDIARIPVLEGGKVVGIIAEHDIALAFASLKESSVQAQKSGVREMQVAPYMRTPAITGNADMTAKQAAALMLEKNIGGLPIVDSRGTIEGIITRTDLIRTFAQAPVIGAPAPA